MWRSTLSHNYVIIKIRRNARPPPSPNQPHAVVTVVKYPRPTAVHIGLVSRIIRGLDSVLLYIVKVTKS